MPDDQTVQPSPTNQPADDIKIEDFEKDLDQSAQITKQQMHQDPALAQSLGATSDMQDAVVDAKKELLDEVVKRLDKDQISPEEAQNLAKEFLSFLPIKNQEDLLEKLHKLSQDNSAAQGIYLKYAKPYEESETNRKLELMSQHLHQGKIEEALAIAKGGTNGG